VLLLLDVPGLYSVEPAEEHATSWHSNPLGSWQPSPTPHAAKYRTCCCCCCSKSCRHTPVHPPSHSPQGHLWLSNCESRFASAMYNNSFMTHLSGQSLRSLSQRGRQELCNPWSPPPHSLPIPTNLVKQNDGNADAHPYCYAGVRLDDCLDHQPFAAAGCLILTHSGAAAAVGSPARCSPAQSAVAAVPV